MQKLKHLFKKHQFFRDLYDSYLLLFRRTYFGGRFATCHNADFMEDELFQKAYRRSIERSGIKYAWHVKIFCWAVNHAMGLEGDLVECGTNRGSSVAAALEYVNWDKSIKKNFYLFDTFEGVVDTQVTSEDKGAFLNEYSECYEETLAYFSKYQGVKLVRGKIPDTLSTVKVDKMAFLHIDMNVAYPEKKALEHFWPFICRGGIVLLDDYGWRGYEHQKRIHDDFAQSVGHEVLPLPTGQGLIVRKDGL